MSAERISKIVSKGIDLYHNCLYDDQSRHCLLGFVYHHLERGEDAAVRELLQFLGDEAKKVDAQTDPDQVQLLQFLTETISSELSQ